MGKYKRETSSESDSSSSEDERRAKKKARKEKKGKKEKKDKKEKKQKKSKGKEKEPEDLVKAARDYLKAQLGGSSKEQARDEPGKPIDPKLQISEADYFAKNAEFTTWLQEELRLMYNDLTSEQTHQFFDQFVKMWNSGRLAPKYYAGAVSVPTKRTAHNWNFKGAGAPGGETGMAAFLEAQKIKQLEAKGQEKQDQRRLRAEQKHQLEELVPKATGREGRIEERKARREESKRDDSPDNLRLPGGGDIYGGDDSFAAAKAREASRQGAQRNRQLLKQEEVSHKAAALQAKEDEKMAAFRAMVAQGPIQIKKRE